MVIRLRHYFWSRSLGVAVAVVVCLSLAAPAGPPSGPPQPDPSKAKPTVELKPGEVPKIKFDHVEYDFPKTPVGREVYHEFTFTNEGNGPLEIVAIKPSCGCTTAGEYDKIVAPGGKGKIPIRVSTGALYGNINKKASVVTNVPGAEGTIDLIVKGEVWEPLSMDPKTIGFGQVAVIDLKDKMPVSKVTITNNSTYPAELTNIRCSSPNFSGEVKVLEPHKKFEFLATLVPPFQGGVINGTFEIDTAVQIMPKLVLTASVYLSAEVEVFPARLPLPNQRGADMERRFTVKNNGKNPITLSELKCSNPEIKLRMEEVTPGMAFVVHMAIPKTYKVRSGGDVVTAKTSSLNTPLVSMIIAEAKNPSSAFGAPLNIGADSGPQPVKPGQTVSSTDQPK